MTRLALALVFVLAVCAPSQAAWTLVAHHAYSSTTSNGFTSAGLNTTGADLLIVALAESATSNDAITSSPSNTWVELSQQVSAGRSMVIWYAKNATVSASQTFTVAGTGNFSALAVEAWSGSLTSGPFDQQNGANAIANSTTTGSVTPMVNNEIVVTGFEFGTTNPTASINGGFTISDQAAAASAISQGVAMAYLIQTTATAANPTWTGSGGADFIAATIATFEQTTGGGATCPATFRTLGVGC